MRSLMPHAKRGFPGRRETGERRKATFGVWLCAPSCHTPNVAFLRSPVSRRPGLAFHAGSILRIVFVTDFSSELPRHLAAGGQPGEKTTSPTPARERLRVRMRVQLTRAGQIRAQNRAR